MKIAYFDTISGISGDMTLGAFIDAGVLLDDLSTEIKKLSLRGIELQATRIDRSSISAIKLDVVISTPRNHHHHLKDIFELIDHSILSDQVKKISKKIFIEVAKAEAKIHNQPIEKIHFHEVGALDSIVDIVGTAICLEKLGIDKVFTSPVKLGMGGFIETEHGKLPIPSPATVEILKEYPTILTEIPFELTTPTGAAIVKSLSSGILKSEKVNIETIGYGAGAKNIPQVPNLLRLMIGKIQQQFEDGDTVIVETNIDDMNPEIFPFVIEKLLSHGASDAFLTPIIMKKGRPGILLSAITSYSKLDDIANIFLSETSTLGIRVNHIERKKVIRKQHELKSEFGEIKIKFVKYGEKERFIPEFEECKRIATEKNIPLIDVYKIIEKEINDTST